MMPRQLLGLSIAICALLLSACSSNTSVSLKQTKAFPIPLFEPYPLRIGKYYSPEFIAYTHSNPITRTTKGKTKVISNTIVTLGEPQTNMFNAVLDGMFTEVIPVSSIQPGAIDSTLDAVFIPSVEVFQYSNPRITRQNVYEIFIKYRIRFMAADGQSNIADFTIPAYGKTPTAMMKSASDAINAATIVALRDVGASLLTRFEKEPDVEAWLEEKSINKDKEQVDE